FTVAKMCETVRHRGPDDNGVWIDANVGLALGHRRLSILDLSSAGHQPMFSNSGRYVITYNGEVYNFLEIAAELEKMGGLSLRAHSDTEMFLAAIERWGVRDSLKPVNGMFALALCARQTRELFLARDPFGKKPRYYGWVGKLFLFGSELKALCAHPGFEDT